MSNEDSSMLQPINYGFRQLIRTVLFVSVVFVANCVSAQGPALLPPAAPPASVTPPPRAQPILPLPDNEAVVIRQRGTAKESPPAAGLPSSEPITIPRTRTSAITSNSAGNDSRSANSGPQLVPVPEQHQLPPVTTFPGNGLQPIPNGPLPPLTTIPQQTNSGWSATNPIQPELLAPNSADADPNSASSSSDFYVPPVQTGNTDYSATKQLPQDYGVIKSAAIEKMLSDVALTILPQTISNNQNWGATREITTGLKMDLDGFRLRTKRNRKKVNHGSWRKLSAKSNSGKPYAVITQIKQVNSNKVSFVATFKSSLTASGEMQEWNRGVRYRTATAHGSAKVSLVAKCSLTWKAVAGTSPQIVQVYPGVESAQLKVNDYDGERLNRFFNPTVASLNSDLEAMVRNHVKKNTRGAAQKMNRHFKSRQGQLRMYFSDLQNSKWGRSIGPQPPANTAIRRILKTRKR